MCNVLAGRLPAEDGSMRDPLLIGLIFLASSVQRLKASVRRIKKKKRHESGDGL